MMMRAIVRLCIVLILAAPAAASAEARCKDKEASDLSAAGTKAYNLQKYEDAIAKWEAAYLKCDDPGLLFNLAQANRKAEHYARARDLYKAWLRDPRTKDDADRQLVKKKIGELDELLAQQKQNTESPPDGVRPGAGTDVAATDAQPTTTTTTEPPATNTVPVGDKPGPTSADATKPTSDAGSSDLSGPTAPQPPHEAPRRWYSDTWGWVLAGGGVAALLAGSGLLVWGNRLEDEARSTPYQDEAASRFDEADGLHTIGAVSLIGGAALLVGGVAHFVVYERSHRRSATMVAVSPTGISFSWSF